MKKNVLKAPKARKIPKELKIHGDVRIDNYYWLNDKENKEVTQYLNEENAYYESKTASTRKFQEDLFQEMKSRIKEDESSVPFRKNGYYYVTRYEKGKQYPIHTRKKENLEAKEEIIFDVNKLAAGHDYFSLVGLNISMDNKIAAFAVDSVSRRQYDLQFKNLDSDEIYPEIIKNTTGRTAWASDNKTVFYTKKDPVTLRSDKVYKHVLGRQPSEDIMVYEEKDDTFGAFVYTSKSDKYIIIGRYERRSPDICYRSFKVIY